MGMISSTNGLAFAKMASLVTTDSTTTRARSLRIRSVSE